MQPGKISLFSPFVMALLVCAAGCHRTNAPGEAPAASAEPEPRSVPAAEVQSPAPGFPDGLDEAKGWLFVENAKDGAAGGWAKGSFDRPRNKLEIRTREVRQFAVDVGQVPIDWSRLVVISIDGKNSELKRRDFALYHFQTDAHGQWVVLEPD